MNHQPDSSRDPAVWRLLGCILPRSIREGVYEPAYLDLQRSVAVAGHGRRWRTRLAWLRVAGYLLASVGYAMPRYFRGQSPVGRWMARVTAVVVAMVALTLLLLPWIMGQLGYYY
jgi:hypothetical protein